MYRSILAVVLVLLVGVFAAGFQRGWLVLSSPSAGEGSEMVNVKPALDRDKTQGDAAPVKKLSTKLVGAAR
jgi:hypothetical protein